MKKIIIIFIVLLSTGCSAQIIDSPTLIKSINDSSRTFLINNLELDGKNPKEDFHIQEILENKVLGYNQTGVYRLYTNKSPSNIYIILKDNDNFKIVDLKNFSASLKEISHFFISSKIEDKKSVKYMEKILEIYNINRYGEKIKM